MTAERPVTVSENGEGPYGQLVEVGVHTLLADEPVELGGHFTGPNPYELLMAGLGACTNMTLRMYATQKQWPLDKVRVYITHEKVVGADGLKRDVFRRALTITGDLTAEQLERLREIADRCPVSRTLQNGAEVETVLA